MDSLYWAMLNLQGMSLKFRRFCMYLFPSLLTAMTVPWSWSTPVPRRMSLQIASVLR